METGIELIAKERDEQLEKHNRSIADDVAYNDLGELIIAAKALLNQSETHIYAGEFPTTWDQSACRKMASKSVVERYIIAGALIAAEIDRLNKLKEMPRRLRP
jgi:glutamine phosphoribosylpyrophosphate amidotransferase